MVDEDGNECDPNQHKTKKTKKTKKKEMSDLAHMDAIVDEYANQAKFTPVNVDLSKENEQKWYKAFENLTKEEDKEDATAVINYDINNCLLSETLDDDIAKLLNIVTIVDTTKPILPRPKKAKNVPKSSTIKKNATKLAAKSSKKSDSSTDATPVTVSNEKNNTVTKDNSHDTAEADPPVPQNDYTRLVIPYVVSVKRVPTINMPIYNYCICFQTRIKAAL